jgi:predicted enzyme related to lactoylglutathione lyase
MKHPVVWFEVLGKDGDKLQRFYSELFGWQIKVDNPMGYGMVDTGSKSGVPGGVGGTFEHFGPWVTFYVESADLAGSLEAAKKLGGKVVMPPKKFPAGPELALFSDPEGHVIGLVKSEPMS